MKFAQATVFLCTVIFNTNNHAAEITGYYSCTGHDPLGSTPYSTHLTIGKTGHTLNFTWESETAKEFTGAGLFSKTNSNIIAAEFCDANDQKNGGVILYTVKPSGDLEGEWIFTNKTLIGTENCIKQPRKP